MNLALRTVTILFLFLSYCFFLKSSYAQIDFSLHFYERKQIEESLASSSSNPSKFLVASFFIAPSYHLYWQNPGPSGSAIRLTFYSHTWNEGKEEKQEFKLESLPWPLPQIFTEAGDLKTFGYKNELFLFFPLSDELFSLLKKGSISVDAHVTYCQTTCTQKTLHVSGRLLESRFVSNAKSQKISEFQFEKSFLLTPHALSVPPGLFKFKIETDNSNILERKILTYEFPYPLFILPLDKSKAFPVNEKTYIISGELKTSRFFYLDEKTQKNYYFDLDLSEHLSYDLKNLLYFILLAFLGGIVLNFMPCVLPVLALKISSPRSSRFYLTLGIYFTFLSLASLAIVLKKTGEIFFWGMHMQSPIVLGLIFAVLFLLALSMFDIIPMKIPFISHITKIKRRSGPLGAFLEGIFITLLSTPCTAPLLASALVFALSQGALEILLIFFSLAIGFTLPFNLGAYVLPRPGIWMLRLKNILASLLLLSSIWFLGLLFSSMNMTPSFLSSIYEKFSITNKKTTWQTWYKDIDINTEHPIFIYFTADWCLNCKAQDLLLFSKDEFSQWATDNKVLLYKADMTVVNLDAQKFLDTHNIPGIPAYYFKGKKEVILGPFISIEDLKILTSLKTSEN